MPDTGAMLPIQISGLSYRAGGRTLIDQIDLEIASKGITVIMGPNGAGKSLLLRLLHGLLPPTSGSIRWDGQPASDTHRRRQAMVFQRPVLLRRSVAANIEFALDLHGNQDPARRDTVLSAVDLQDYAAQPARRLSGGEQQRLALARALATDPEVLFLDEPTANLDPAATAVIEAAVGRIRDAGTKAVFVTHDIGQARRLADDIVFMHRGRICETGYAVTFFDTPRTSEAQQFLQGELVL
mgnify:FL=1